MDPVVKDILVGTCLALAAFPVSVLLVALGTAMLRALTRSDAPAPLDDESWH